ncbi:MAG TPA: hypothetical protein DDX39_02355 [Bacteroidales bacterium]|nr:MAG: hypothetical protein A2W98_05570 [Bacteroidetes bacterium GWF2_33_38]HBF87457.1 hypothetical protein [Bacteroidales bacterium]
MYKRVNSHYKHSTMRQFKKIELLPLTDFANLDIHVVDEKHFDLTKLGISQEATKELLSKIYSIASKSPGVIIASKVGDRNFVNTQVKTSRDKKKLFTFPEPNPICIYYKSANEHLEKSYSIKNKLYAEEQHFNIDYHYESFIEYFQETSEGIILLSTTIEGFINQLLEDNLELTIDGSLKTKSEIEWCDINTKLRQVIPQLTGIDFQQTNGKDYDNICLIIELRNDLIHLKRSIKANVTNYQLLFKQLTELDHIACSDSIFTFINTIIPNYLIERE